MTEWLRLLIEHGPLSKPAEIAQLLIALIGFGIAALADGDSDARPVGAVLSVAAIISLVISVAAPPAITEEWHVGIIVVVLIGSLIVYNRSS